MNRTYNMSADNWALCPRCVDNANTNQQELQSRVIEEYGKLPLTEWENLRKLANAGVDKEVFTTFREDYEIYGADTGTITINYSGTCTICGLSVQYDDSKRFYGKGIKIFND